MAFLPEMIRQALAQVHAGENMGEAGLCRFVTAVDRADSTGFALPDRLPETFPGAGGSAAQAGAKMHAVWAYQSQVLGPCARTPWHIPDQPYSDTGVA